jgi:hypothetical protein
MLGRRPVHEVLREEKVAAVTEKRRDVGDCRAIAVLIDDVEQHVEGRDGIERVRRDRWLGRDIELEDLPIRKRLAQLSSRFVRQITTDDTPCSCTAPFIDLKPGSGPDVEDACESEIQRHRRN